MKLLKKIKTMIIKYFYDLFHFGIKIAYYSFLGELCDFNIIKGSLADQIDNKRKEAIYNFLIKKYHTFIEEYKNKEIKVGKNTKKIWCLWWQGIENAPLIVKKCVNSIKKNKGDYDFILITKDNYSEYVDIDEYIINKLEKKQITITHFSDILRARLLSTYGGVWVDATMYFTTNIFKEFDNIVFNSNREEKIGDYTGFFMGGKPNKLFFFLYDFLVLYNKDYSKLINYFLIDYTFLIAYRNFEDCHNYIDSITIENGNIYELVRCFNQEYNKKEYNKLTNKTFFKLTYKKQFKDYVDDKLTNYGYFIEKSD